MRDCHKKVRDKIETRYIKILILELLLEIYYHRFGSTDLTTCLTWKSKEYIVWEYWANIIRYIQRIPEYNTDEISLTNRDNKILGIN